MRIDVATLFPEVCEAFMQQSIIGRAQNSGHILFKSHQIRNYTTNRQNQVDDYPYGGGHGMIMQAQPIYDCCNDIIRTVKEERNVKPHIVFMTAGGQTLTQQKCKELANKKSILIVCGHYEGIDERVIDELADEEISVGDYVLTGGELPALILADSVFRLCPGVLKCEQGFEEESFYNGLLEYPQYSRPSVWNNRQVPEVLLSGNHKKIDDWRKQQSILRTKLRRPDLFEKFTNSNNE